MAQLIPALQRIQQQFGYLKREALQQFSDESGVPLYRLHSVASFFPHFQLTPPKPVRLRICRDMACNMAGAGKMLRELAATRRRTNVAVEGVSCLGRCDRAPAACVAVTGSEHEYYYHGRSAEELKQIAESWLRGDPSPADHDGDQPFSPAPLTVDPYAGAEPAYAAVLQGARDARCGARRRGEMLVESGRLDARTSWRSSGRARSRRAIERTMSAEVADAVRAWNTEDDWAKGPELAGWSEALLDRNEGSRPARDRRRGHSGDAEVAGRARRGPDGVRAAGRHRAFIVVNGDESEPGTFKDRELLLRTPHLVIEGVILAGLLTEATEGFIFIRHEYPEQIAACRAEIERAEQLGVCGPNASLLGRPFPVSVFVSPGGYICGEQSALIEAMSDRRGEPRNMPPKLETNGLEDLPTLVSNVETFAWVPYIAINGGAAVRRAGRERLERPPVLLRLRRREAAGRLRGADGPDAARTDLRRAILPGHRRRRRAEGLRAVRAVGRIPAGEAHGRRRAAARPREQQGVAGAGRAARVRSERDASSTSSTSSWS